MYAAGTSCWLHRRAHRTADGLAKLPQHAHERTDGHLPASAQPCGLLLLLACDGGAQTVSGFALRFASPDPHTPAKVRGSADPKFGGKCSIPPYLRGTFSTFGGARGTPDTFGTTREPFKYINRGRGRQLSIVVSRSDFGRWPTTMGKVGLVLGWAVIRKDKTRETRRTKFLSKITN